MTDRADRQLSNDIQACLKVCAGLKTIREASGFGSIRLDVNDGCVVYVAVTVGEQLRNQYSPQ